MNYGWRQFYRCNNYGADVLTRRNNLWIYCGTINKNSLRHYGYYRIKLSRKIRLRHMWMKKEWDGYYYFGLYQKQYDAYLAQQNKRGRKRKTFTFNNVFLYKLEDDCLVRNPATVAIFRYPMTLPTKFKLYLSTLVTDKAELLYLHNPLKLEDIMKINEKYKFLCK